jgi:hypothetical protein
VVVVVALCGGDGARLKKKNYVIHCDNRTMLNLHARSHSHTTIIEFSLVPWNSTGFSMDF